MSNKTISSNSKRIIWIDAAKFATITAVLVDHTYGILYKNESVFRLSYFSISVFILLMGITTFLSFQKNGTHISRKILSITLPYITATFITCIIKYQSFDFEIFINHLIHFNVCPPYYYVLLYIQLVVVSPILFKYLQITGCKQISLFYDILMAIPVLFLSSWTTNHSNILSIYGGGGKLLGGSYLLLLYIGMCFGKYYYRINLGKWISLLLLSVISVLLITWGYVISQYRFILDGKQFLGLGANPPGFTLILYAILITGVFYTLGAFLDNYPESPAAKIFTALSIPGKHTLYIFLYHWLFLDFLINPNIESLYRSGHFTKPVRILCFLVLMIGPVFAEYILKLIHKSLAACYKKPQVIIQK